MTKEELKAHRYYEPIRNVLLRKWDPIGIGDSPEAQDEYDAYAPVLCEMLILGKTRQDVFNYLWWLETEHIGLSGNRDATEKASDLLLQIPVHPARSELYKPTIAPGLPKKK